MGSAELLVKNARIWTSVGIVEGRLPVRDGKMISIGKDYRLAPGDREIDVRHNLVIPGPIRRRFR